MTILERFCDRGGRSVPKTSISSSAEVGGGDVTYPLPPLKGGVTTSTTPYLLTYVIEYAVGIVPPW